MYAPRILLIEAGPETHRALRGRLQRRGFEVFEAKTQSEAVRRAGEVGADLVVQENAVARPDDPGTLDEVMGAIELLAGPLPLPARRAPLGGRRLLARTHRARPFPAPVAPR